MSVKEGRILNPDEEVDHIDNNALNDDINNLQLLSAKENRKKQSLNSSHVNVKLKCPMCGKVFVRIKGITHLTKGRKTNYTTCSRSCGGRFSMMIYYNKFSKDELDRRISENVIEVFKENYKEVI